MDQAHQAQMVEIRNQKQADQEKMEAMLREKIDNLGGLLGLVQAEGSSNDTELKEIERHVVEQKEELDDNKASAERMEAEI
jgi:hypothetical protein